MPRDDDYTEDEQIADAQHRAESRTDRAWQARYEQIEHEERDDDTR